MRQIRCPLCGHWLTEDKCASCPNCGNRLALSEFNAYYKLEYAIRVAHHQLDVLLEDLYSRNEYVQDNYKDDIRNGVVTDPRDINE